jgi:hypothetical protein|tara:strand:+ start:497 stop:1822 length:1326 start_codon:yes stop_codon:yes gene_type:complete
LGKRRKVKTFELLDRLELLYPTNTKLADLRRSYIDKDISSIFRLLPPEYEELRKAVIENNVHSIFRLLPPEYEELRKAVIEQNLHSIFRLLPPEHDDLRKAVLNKNLNSIFKLLPDSVDADTRRKAMLTQDLHGIFSGGDDNLEELRKAILEQNLHSIFRLVDDEELRKAILEQNLHSIFRLVDDEELRKAIVEQNLHSIFRLVDDEDLRKLLLEDNIWKLWPVLSRYVNTQFVDAFKNFFVNDTEIWDDCFARGQLESKLWLVRELQQCDIPLGTVFICAGWYATIATMLFESDIEVDKIRSFDMDTTCASIAEVFNKPWVVDAWKFKASYKDIHDIDFTGKTPYSVYKSNGEEQLLLDSPDTIINTSCEHIENFEEWYAKIPDGKLVILQSNNFYDVEEHVNCVADVDEFINTAPMSTVLYSGELALPKYNRFMIIGYK